MIESPRSRIIDAAFQQTGPFTASFVAGQAGVDPRDVYLVLINMDCVSEAGTTAGKLGPVKQYARSGSPPESCEGCAFAAPKATSCRRAPGDRGHVHMRDGVVTRGQWEAHLKKLEEAQTGALTDANGDLIIPIFGRMTW